MGGKLIRPNFPIKKKILEVYFRIKGLVTQGGEYFIRRTELENERNWKLGKT